MQERVILESRHSTIIRPFSLTPTRAPALAPALHATHKHSQGWAMLAQTAEVKRSEEIWKRVKNTRPTPFGQQVSVLVNTRAMELKVQSWRLPASFVPLLR